MSIKSFIKLVGCLSLLMAPIETTSAAVNVAEPQIKCLADNAYFEARGQSTEGVYAVMHVVINRTTDGRFPSTPCGVVYQKGQFTWTRAGKRRINEVDEYLKIRELAREVYYREHDDNTGGAKYFRLAKLGGACVHSHRIGAHIFCR